MSVSQASSTKAVVVSHRIDGSWATYSLFRIGFRLNQVRQVFLVIAAVLCASPIARNCLAKERAPGDGVLHAASECRASLKALGGISMHITGTVEATNEIDALGAVAGVRVSEVVRCQSRERVSTYFDQQGSSEQEQYRQEYIVDEDGAVLAIQAMFDRQGRQRPATLLSDLSVVLADQRLVKQGTTVRNRGDVYVALQESGAALGWVGRAHLADYIQGEIEAEGSGDATLIASQGPLGDVEMSLSQTHGYLPNSIRIRKRADSLYGGERVASAFSVRKPPPSTVLPPDTEASPSVTVRSMEWRMNVGAYEKAPNGVWYPAQIALVQTHLFDDGRRNVTKSRLSVVADDRAPDACGPQTRIPEGYAVYVEKAPQLPYRWSGSDPEPGVPELPLYETLPTSPISAEGKGRMLLLAVNVGLVGVLCLVLLYRWVRAPSK